MLILWVSAIALAWLGSAIPIHFRAISPAVIEHAKENGQTWAPLDQHYLEMGRPGPIRIIWEASSKLPSSEACRLRVIKLLEENPSYWVTGGPAPYLETFMSLLPPESLNRPQNILSFILQKKNRQELLGFLEQSKDQLVLDLLEFRQFTGFEKFYPVNSPAGQPLDASLLISAMLVQGNHLDPELRQELRQHLFDAYENKHTSIQELEDFFLGILSIGKRVDWISLTEVIRKWNNLQEFNHFCYTLQTHSKYWETLIATVFLLDKPNAIAPYLEHNPDTGLEALAYASEWGEGSLQVLFQRQKSLYTPPPIARQINEHLPKNIKQPLIALALTHPHWAFTIKFLALLIASYALAISISRILQWLRIWKCRRIRDPLMLACNGILAILFSVVLWSILEPHLMEFGEKQNAQLHLDFEIVTRLESLTSQPISPTMLDQVTIIVILFFFFLQLIVYFFGLLRLKEIKKQELETKTKLALLENEENLFDLGLYVGLSGTVTSLILLAMDIVQASLIAAYASTLFGIIFAAILKIFNLRPYRRELILKETPKSNSNHE